MTYQSEEIVPYTDKGKKTDQVRAMFNNIAHCYDLFNHLASLGIDRYWRRKGIGFLRPYHPQEILDIATGTGDYAINAMQMLHPQRIVGIDLSVEMMKIGEQKVLKLAMNNVISFRQEDATCLSFPDNSFDAITVAFGVRNFSDIEKGYAEMFRVLKPGGYLSVLELTTPSSFPMKYLYWFYSWAIIPLLGKILSRDKEPYQYLPASIKVVPQFEQMVAILDKMGFQKSNYESLTCGICALYTAQKPIN